MPQLGLDMNNSGGVSLAQIMADSANAASRAGAAGNIDINSMMSESSQKGYNLMNSALSVGGKFAAAKSADNANKDKETEKAKKDSQQVDQYKPPVLDTLPLGSEESKAMQDKKAKESSDKQLDGVDVNMEANKVSDRLIFANKMMDFLGSGRSDV